MRKIYLAAGCFWGAQEYLKRIEGVSETVVGYANSHFYNPMYEDVCNGDTNAVETVEVVYDDNIVSLNALLDYYFKVIDPTSLNRQGNDVGTQYRTGIYFIDDDDELLIKDYICSIKDNYNDEIVTEVKKLENFFIAEEYHQNYLTKNSGGYCHIKLD